MSEYVDEYPSVEVLEQKKIIVRAKCLRCGGVWCPKAIDGVIKNMPKCCTHCKSPYWNKPRLRTGDAASPNKYGFDALRVGVWMAFPWFLKPDGSDDWEANAKRARSLEQYMRRHGYAYEHRNGTPTAPGLHIRRRT